MATVSWSILTAFLFRSIWSIVSPTDAFGAGFPPRLEFSLPQDPARLLRARARIREYLGHLTLDETAIDDVVLAVMEAATNALQHSGASSAICISLSVADDELVAAVRDDGRGFDPSLFPVDEIPDLASPGGRGLFLITRLTDGVEFRFQGGTEVRMRKRLAVVPGPTAVDFVRAASPERLYAGLSDRLIEMLEAGDECFAALDWEWRYVYVNRAAERFLGCSRDELLSRALFEVSPWMAGTEFERQYRLVMEQGVVAHFEAYNEPLGLWEELRVYPAPFGIAIYFRDITSRKRVESEYRELLRAAEGQRAQLGAVLEHLSDGILILDAQANVLEANAEARRLTGLGTRASARRSADAWPEFELLDGDGRRLARGASPAERVVRGERFSGQEVTVRNVATGREVLASFDGVPLRDERGRVALAVLALRDIGEQKRTELRTALHGAILRGITEILEAALVCRDEEALGRTCLRVVEDITQSRFGFIDELADDGRLVSIAMSDAGRTLCELEGHGGRDAERRERAAVVRGLHGEVIKRGATLLCNAPAEHPASVGVPPGHVPLESFLGVPLKRGGQTVGMVAVGNRAGGYTDDQRWALESVAPVIVQAVDRLRARGALHESLARTRVLASIAAAAAGADRPEQVSEAVLVAAARHLGLKAGSVNVLVEDRRELRRLATFGAAYASQSSRAPIPLDETLNIGRLLLHKLPYLTHESPGQSEASRRRFAAMGLANDSWVKVPVTARDQVVGAMTLVFPGRRSFKADEIAFYRAVADQLGVALQRARLAEEREAQRALQARIGELSLVLDAVNDAVRGVDEPLSAIAHGARLAAEAIMAAVASVYVYEEGQWRQIVGERGEPLAQPAVAQEVPLGELVREALRPIAVCRLASAARTPSEEDPWAGSLLGVPLTAGSSFLGAVFFAAEAARGYSDEEYHFARKVGAALGGALQNSQLYLALNAQLELSRLLLRASKVLTQWTDLEPMLERLTDVLLLSAPGSRATIALLDLDRKVLELVASKGIAPLRRGVYSVDTLPAAVRDAVGAPGTAVVDYAAHPSAGTTFPDDRFRPRHGLWVPVVARDRAIGLLSLEAPETRQPFTAAEVRAVEAIADQAATAIENARLYVAELEAQRRAERELEISQVLLLTAAAFSSETDPRQLLDIIAETITRSFDGARVSISLRGENGRDTIVATAGDEAYPLGTVYALEDYSAPARRAMVTGRAVIVDYEALSPDERGSAGDRGMRKSIVAPLVTRGRTIGMMFIDHPREKRDFSRRDVSLAQGIADQAAVAIDNATLFDKVREEARFGEALDRAGRLLHSSLDDDTILAGALESGGEALRASSGVIAVYERARWVVKYQYGFAANLVGRSWPNEAVPFMAQARREHRPVVLGEVAALAGGDVAVPPGVRSTLVAPLSVGDEVLGVLVYNKPDPGAFSEPEVAFATRLASSVSLAVQNARLFASEHTIAETLQEALLAMPERIEGFAMAHRYHSATVAARVGGDFYDVFEMSPGVVAVVVGDVSGKGLDAAVLTSVVKNAIRAQAFDGEKAPADVLRVVNEVLLRGSAPEVFASVFLGVIDGRRSVMDYCNAGHTPALVLRDGGVVEQLPPTSPVVGAFPELTYSSARTRLAPGELLFLYTDGLVEARVNGVLFGEAGLLALFAEPGMSDVATAVERAASAVFEFADGRLSDDLALLAISPTVGHPPSAQGGLRSSGHDMPD